MSSTEQQAPGIKRTDLQQHDLSVPGREVIQNRVDIGPEAPFVKHKHPGEESSMSWKGRWSIMSKATRRRLSTPATSCSSRPKRSTAGTPAAATRRARHVRRRKGKPFIVLVE